MTFIILSLLASLISLCMLYKNKLGEREAYVVSIVFVFLMVLNGVYFVANSFTGKGIDASVLFHVRAGLDGAGISEYKPLIALTASYFIVLLLISIVIFNKVKRHQKEGSSTWRKVALMFIGFSFFLNPAVHDFSRMTLSSLSGGTYANKENFPNEFLLPTPSISEKKNLVFIYLESLEATYLDEDLFPGLMPNLKRLQQSATNYSNIQQVTHTSWTIAGMTASQCGIPLFSPSHGNSLSGLDMFLPEANCLGDILKSNGYYLSYMGGADLNFAGKGSFYKSHGFDNIQGKRELSSNSSDPDYLSSWGIYDDTLFSMLKDEYARLSRSTSPFGLFSLTLDTHHPSGHVSNSCRDVEYQDGTNPILNSVHCADILIKEFVDYIQENPDDNDTVIAIASDHLAMKNSAWDTLQQGTRRNIFMVIDSMDPQNAANVSKAGSVLDIAPTLLSFFDTSIDGLAFGRNLNVDSPTLTESKNNINSYLKSQQGAVKYLWSYPQLESGIQYQSNNEGELVLGNRYISLPAIIKVNNRFDVEEIVFANTGRKKLADYITEFPVSQNFLWIDECEVVNAFAYPNNTGNGSDNWCVASGTTGGSEISAWGLSDKTTITNAEILSSFEEAEISEKAHLERVSRMQNIVEFGVAELSTLHVSTSSDMVGSVVVRSAGYNNGPSFVEGNGRRLGFYRGLTLVGLSNSHEPVRIGHVDTCGGTVTDPNVLDASGDFSFMIEKYSASFDALIVVGHDSIVCSDTGLLENTMQGTGLENWSNVGLREPYIAVIAKGGDVQEIVGEDKSIIAVNVKSYATASEPVSQRVLDGIERVAHAGGGYDGLTYTNSIDALEYNKNIYSLFEIDFSWSSDNELVCIHDWEDSFERSFGLSTASAVTENLFIRLVEESSIEKCTLSSLSAWLKDNPEKRIVTDIKSMNSRALNLIASRYPELIGNFIPQVYQPQEYYIARLLGFDDVIWTLYRFRGDDDAVLSNLENMDLYGLTMPRERANSGLAKRVFDERGLHSYVHTINSEEDFFKYLNLGVSEIYTDWLKE